MKQAKHKADAPKQVSDGETAKILALAQNALLIEGDLVELGCYRGDTSVLLERMLETAERTVLEKIVSTENPTEKTAAEEGTATEKTAETSPQKALWIYDSFEGLPPHAPQDGYAAGVEFKEGELLVTKREVIEKFKRNGLRVPKIKKGFFEDLTAADLPAKIAFAFLDGDLYTSIKASLKLVVSRMSRGGIIIVHDYTNSQLPGVAKAVDEWLKPGQKIERFETLAIIKC